MEIVKQTGRRGSPVKKVDDAVDGHNYYIINGDDSAAKPTLHFIDFYGDLARYSPITEEGGIEKVGSVQGFFFVRNAADMSIKGDGKGDPTVHAGWAIYVWDAKDYIERKPATNAGWVKISQQGDMDWDITDELKAMFVLKTVFNARVNEVDIRFSQDEAVLKQVSNRLLEIEKNWDEGDDVHGKAHEHHEINDWDDPENPVDQGDNFDVLNRLSDHFDILYYRGKPIGGNSYIYDHVEHITATDTDEIVWCDPTKPEAEWTHEVVKNSAEIANRITELEFARVGMSLFVVEANGDLTIYKYIRQKATGGMVACGPQPLYDITEEYYRQVMPPPVAVYQIVAHDTLDIYTGGDGKLHINRDDLFIKDTEDKIVAQYAQTIVKTNHGIAEYTDTLPTAAKEYLGRGCWVPLKKDGVHAVGHLHKCVETGTGTVEDPYVYTWVDISEGGTAEITEAGAKIDVAYADSDTMWKTNHIFWTDPADALHPTTGLPVNWSTTTIVRKYGSAPANPTDGTVVASTVRSSDPTVERVGSTIDVIPQTHEEVYYRAFSTSTEGLAYVATDAVHPVKLDWTETCRIIQEGLAEKVFAIGDEIVLPYHETYGYITCEVVAINKSNANNDIKGLLVVSKDVICQKAFDCLEPNSISGTNNPEYTEASGVGARGSNGYIDAGKHNCSSLNIIRWLNSSATDWWGAAPTTAPWDQKPTDTSYGYVKRDGTMEEGFMKGFEDTSMFKELDTETDGSTTISVDTEFKVSIPMAGSFYFANISNNKYKQYGTSSAHADWATLTGTASTVTETRSRVNYGFKTVTQDAGGTMQMISKAPEVVVGIVPMFLIGGTTTP